MKRVLIADGSIFPEIYKPTEHWRRLLGEVGSDSIHLPSGDPIPALDDYSHLIITGSEASVIDDIDWFAAEELLIREAVKLHKPILGSCFGHQMLARAISGIEYARRSASPELGWNSIEVTGQDELFDGIKNPFSVFVSHFDEVCDPPLPWKVLGANEACAVHIMRYADRPVWGIQSHPEITPEDGRILLEGLNERIPEGSDLILAALQQKPCDDRIAEEIVQRFLNT
jgi:GMP synthase-like glutamine amidotransferase